jgi:nicotinamide riboside transporter PnuC
MDIFITYTQLGTTSNYSATANFHNSQIVTAPDKPFPKPAVPLQSLSLAAASNSGDSSASPTQVLSSQPPVHNSLSYNSAELIALTVLVITSCHGPHRKHCSSIVAAMPFATGMCLTNSWPEMAALWTIENAILLLLHACCGNYLVTVTVYRVFA